MEHSHTHVFLVNSKYYSKFRYFLIHFRVYALYYHSYNGYRVVDFIVLDIFSIFPIVLIGEFF